MITTRMIPLALAAGLAFAWAVPGQAPAQDDGDNRLLQLDMDGNRALSLREFLASRIGFHVDADSDGTVTWEEYLASLQRAGPDGLGENGQQRQERERKPEQERQEEQEEQEAREMRGMQELRQASRGVGADPERERLRQRIEQRLGERFASMDIDGDGVVTLTEYRTSSFANLDQNGNGMLEGAELTARGERVRRGAPSQNDNQRN